MSNALDALRDIVAIATKTPRKNTTQRLESVIAIATAALQPGSPAEECVSVCTRCETAQLGHIDDGQPCPDCDNAEYLCLWTEEQRKAFDEGRDWRSQMDHDARVLRQAEKKPEGT